MKKYFIFLLTLAVLAFLIPLSSATDLTLSPTSLTYDIDTGHDAYKTFSLLYESPLPVQFNGNLTWSNPNSDITLTSNQTTFSLDPFERTMFKITVDVDSDADDGTYHADIAVYNTDSGVKEKTLPVTITVGNTAAGDYCEDGEQGSYLTLSFDEPDSGDDFYAGDNMTVKVDIENDYDEDLDVIVKAQLYDLDDEDDISNVKYSTTIDAEDSKTVTVHLDVPSNIDPDHSYVVRAKVYEESNEEEQCKEDSVDVNLDKKSHNIAIDSLYLSPTSVGCGDAFSVSLKISNTGSNDEDIKIVVRNSELGIDYTKTSTVDEGDDYSTSFSFTVPINVSEKNYIIPITVYYDDYDSSKSDEVSLLVSGKCSQQPVGYQDVMLNSQQLGDAFPGSDFVVKVSLTNTGNILTTYNVNVSDYSGWATLVSVQPSTLAMNQGTSGDVYITLRPSDNAAGTNTFKVRVTFGTTTKEQIISVPIKNQSTSASWFDQFNFEFNRNWKWILTDVILVAVIIALIVFLVRKNLVQEEPTEIRVRTVNGKIKKNW